METVSAALTKTVATIRGALQVPFRSFLQFFLALIELLLTVLSTNIFLNAGMRFSQARARMSD